MSSTSSSDDDSREFRVFYKGNPEWQDIEPIPQDEGPGDAVDINYSPEFREVYDYFRAILKKQEKSRRALKLTAHAIKLNAANYTVWQYRREILRELQIQGNYDMSQELSFTKLIITEVSSKNYQVWQHRKLLIEMINDPSHEKELINESLEKDAKNYHAWQYRQWVVSRYDLFEGELNFVNKMLVEDVRNNSVWNYRYFIINNTTGFTEEIIDNEIDYTFSFITRAIENESSWNYLRGLLIHSEKNTCDIVKVTDFCQNLYTYGNRSPFLLAFIIDICEEHDLKKKDNPFYNLQMGISLCEELSKKYDPIRTEYWNYIASTLSRN